MRFDLPSIMYEVPLDDHLRGVYGAYWELVRDIAWIIVLRTRVAEAQAWRCCYCGIRTDHDDHRLRRPTLEHVVPRVRGGEDVWENAVMACSPCNRARGVQVLAEEAFLHGGACDAPTALDEPKAKGKGRRRKNLRAELRTPEGWDTDDSVLAERLHVSVDDVVKFRAHRTFKLGVRDAQDRTCPACERKIRDEGSLIVPVVDGHRRFEIVHERCYQNYRRWLVLQGLLPDKAGNDGDPE